MKTKNCKQTDCPLRYKCAIAQHQVEGNVTIFRGYLPEAKKCEMYIPIKKEKEIEK